MPSLFNLNGICGTDCPPNQHFIDGLCKNCTNPLCLCTRDDLDSCTACKDPLTTIYLYSQQLCVLSCPDPNTTYYDKGLQECMPCHDYCEGCKGPSNRECVKCKSNYTIFNQTICVPKSCQAGQFFDEASAQCKECEFPCQQCKKNAQDCTLCVENYAYDSENTCVQCTDITGFDFPWRAEPKVPGGGACTEICGDGLNFGFYECDDGNIRNGDGCSSKCKIEKSYGCDGGS